MMGPASTVRVAIDLMHVPSQVRFMRSNPLPDDVHVLLRIASGDEEAARHASERLGRSLELVRAAAAFFVEQILLFPDADSYRVLGARPEATNGELRRNMALLLQWMHPDRDRQGERSVFVTRVTRAWNDLKTPERRAGYDRLRRISQTDKSLKKSHPGAQSKEHRSRQRVQRAQFGRYASRRALRIYSDERRGLLRRILLLLFGRTAH